MTISLIAAVANNGVIGKNNSLPWHLPADMKYFRDITMGHCVIMGRKNYDSIPLKYRPLEGRINIVITRQKNFTAPQCIVVHSIKEALEEAKQNLVPKGRNTITPFRAGAQEVFIIGGAEIYRQTITLADKLYITHIHYAFEGDAFFPKIDLPRQRRGAGRWRQTMRTDIQPDEKNKYPFSFCVYERM